MLLAEIVSMWVALLCQVVDPNQSAAVLIRQGQTRLVLARRLGTLSCHDQTLTISTAPLVDSRQ
jgi:hypothetical protein